MYNMPLPISAIRTRVRQEFERNRFAAKLPVVDVLLFKSHAEYQVCLSRYNPTDHSISGIGSSNQLETQEMMNFWKQTTHVMSYFKEENFRGDKRLPSSFMEGFMEVNRPPIPDVHGTAGTNTDVHFTGSELDKSNNCYVYKFPLKKRLFCKRRKRLLFQPPGNNRR